MLIIPDTNFLIYATKYRLWHNVKERYGKYSILILPEVFYELEQLGKKSKGKDRELVLLTLKFLKTQKFKLKKKKGHADKVLVEIGKWLREVGEKNFIIATMDKNLAKKLKKNKIKILSIRQKKYLREK